MSPYIFSSNNFKEFCKDNDLTEKDGFLIILQEINRLSEEKKKIMSEVEPNEFIDRVYSSS